MTLFSAANIIMCLPDDLSEFTAAGYDMSDAVELSDDELTEFLGVQAPAGKMLGAANGRPTWVDLPPKTKDELAADAQSKMSTALAVATEKIAPLQDAVDLGIATAEETASLTAWKTYRVAVNRVPTQSGYPTTIDWPPMPE